MRAHYLQHVPFEGPGSIETWLKNAGYKMTCTRFYDSGELPCVEETDLLVIMGGPMSVNDENVYPWLAEEKKFIKRAVLAGKPVLGICLGAQLIASAMGARVFPNPVKEIGWFPVQAVVDNEKPHFTFPSSETVFHWHGETFDLPPDALRLAKSEVCENQAFQLGQNVIGLQFHLETTPESARAIVTNCRDELVTSRFIQTEEEILSADSIRYDSIHDMMNHVLLFLKHAAAIT